MEISSCTRPKADGRQWTAFCPERYTGKRRAGLAMGQSNKQIPADGGVSAADLILWLTAGALVGACVAVGLVFVAYFAWYSPAKPVSLLTAILIHIPLDLMLAGPVGAALRGLAGILLGFRYRRK
jgi:hypothetical protein